MSLAEDLNGVRTTLQKALPPPAFHAIADSIEALTASGLAGQAVGVGEHVRVPVLDGVDGGTVDLPALSAGRPIVLVFYRGGWCPYCDVTLRAYAKARSRIDAAGAALVAITPQVAPPADGTAPSLDLGFPIAIDRGNAFARSLGLVFALPETLRPLYRDIEIDLPAHNGDESHELPIPATYILDASGRVVWAHVEADFTTRADPAAVLAALAALASHLDKDAEAA